MASFIDEFHIPTARDSYEDSTVTDDRKCIYLSRAVGTQPKATEENILQVLKDWKTFGVSALARGFLPTIHCESKVKPLLAPLVGAKENEIAVMNHLSVNLHLLMNSFYSPKGRYHPVLRCSTISLKETEEKSSLKMVVFHQTTGFADHILKCPGITLMKTWLSSNHDLANC